MPEGDDWLLRPVLKGLCKYESLKDGTLTLVDMARMNDMLDVQLENDMRIAEANKDP